MRIGIMLRTLAERQGIGVYTHCLIDELLRLDTVNEYVLFYRDDTFLGRYADPPRVKECVVKARNKALWDQVAVPRAARRARVDVIFHTKFTVPLFSSIPSVMTLHGASWFVRPELYENKLDLAYIRAVMPLYCRKASRILANSDLTRDDFIRILHVPADKITTTHLAAGPHFKPIDDAAALEAARSKYKLPERFVLSVIKYDPRKNFENLIAAFRLLRRTCPDAKLVVAGNGCDRYVAEYGLDDDGTSEHVQFLGFVDQAELPLLYNLAYCKFFPSVYEEFGIPTCEAMACGCPPVVARTGALPEIAGDAGIAVDPFDPPAMAEALAGLWRDPEQRAMLSRRSLERARQFTWRRCAERTLAVLNSLAPIKPGATTGTTVTHD